MDKKLAIVIPVFNNWTHTKRALSDLSALPSDHLIIIIDNGSTDNTKDLNSSGKIFVIRNQNNIGFAKSSNQGFELAVKLGYENVMFLNNDIRVLEDCKNKETWTNPLIDCAREGHIVGPTVGCLDENFNFICESNKFPSRGYSYLSGWNLTASTETWKHLVLENDIGPFNTKFISYFEDTDLSFRAKKLGIELKVVDVPVKHIGRVTGKKVGISALYSQSRKIFTELWSMT